MYLMRGMISIRARLSLYALALLVAACAFASPIKLGVVTGHSMSPTFRSGQPYVLDRSYYRTHAVRRGDVVVFTYDGATCIKRVAAAPGDMVYLLKENGSDEDTVLQDWQLRTVKRSLDRYPWNVALKLVKRRIPRGYCFVLGDNIDNSVDSRDYGPIPMVAIQGRVVGPSRRYEQLQHIAGSFRSSSPS